MPIKEAVLNAARATGLAAAARAATGSSLRILGYHGLWLTPGYAYGDCLFISPDQFEARMARLKRSGLAVLPLAEAVDGLARATLPRAAVVITIDDGWASTYTHMLPVLEALGLPATLYATTWYSQHGLPVVNVAVDYMLAASGRGDVDRDAEIDGIEALPVGERLSALRALGDRLGVDEAWLELRQFHNMTAAELADAHRRGLDIQLHTHRHIDVTTRIGELSREIAENRAFLTAALGDVPLDHFCFPGGGHHPLAPQVLERAGIRSATLVEEGLSPPGSSPYKLKRLLDGRQVGDATFDAYLAGTLHYLSTARRLVA